MTKVLIVFYSRTGNTEALAKSIAEGATAAGAEVRMRRAREFVSGDVMAMAPGWKDAADAMNAKYEAPERRPTPSGPTPSCWDRPHPLRHGRPPELKAWIDSLGGLWFQGKLVGKVGAAFSATGSIHGGNEATILSLWQPMAHLGMIIVPNGYGDPVMFRAGTPYGATTISYGQKAAPPTSDDLEVARYQGRRVAEVTAKLRE